MKKQPPQSSLILRVLGGGYLIYLGWDLFSTSDGQIKFWVAAGFFALVGAALLGSSLWTLARSDYFRNDPPENE